MIANRKQGWIGVDIGTHCIKLAQVERVRGSMRLVDAAVLRRRAPWQLGDAGETPDPESSADSVSAAVALGGRFSGQRAACVLPMHLLDVRAMIVPPGTLAERRSIMTNELAGVPQVGVAGRVFDYWDLAAGSEAQQQAKENVYVASVSQGWAERAYRDLSAVRLRCQALDVGPLAMAHALQAGDTPDPAATIATVDWGFTNVTLCVLQHGTLTYLRVLRDCGLDRLIAAVQQALGVTFEQAQHLLTSEGLASDTAATSNDGSLGQILTEATENALRNLIEQINKTFDYLKAQRRMSKPDSLTLVGGGATVKHIFDYLGTRVCVPVVPLDFRRLGVTAAGRWESSAALLSTAVALSQRRWSQP